MGITYYKIKKWYGMLTGNSVHHVNQDEGKVYSKEKIEGYYNNLTEKITRFGRPDNKIPLSYVDTGEEIEFSIEIFQYGLAAYDLYLISKKTDKDFFDKVLACANWAIEHQQTDGSWITFEYSNPDNPYSSMAQGEGISLLLRAFLLTGKELYKEAAVRAKQFMLLSIEQGGTTKYIGNRIYLYESPAGSLVLNGWIFSIWGLMDYCKFFEDANASQVLDLTLKTLESDLNTFDICYWSWYDDEGNISSPFYHNLHIAQLRVMYDLTGQEIYNTYSKKWDKQRKNFFFRNIAFIKKVIQKVSK